jgi:4,5-DOPA dioxygenase extradiol
MSVAAFIGHGSPMNTIESNRFTSAWREFGATMKLPEAIVVISAHWFVPNVSVTAMPQPRTIHDFYGFPSELFEFQYPAPGHPTLARRIAELLAPLPVQLDSDEWGLDHGTWSVLAHIVPNADIPVVQLSIDATKSAEEHVEIGRRLAPLLVENIMLLGSGNIVHNLGMIDWSMKGTAFNWARDFDAEAQRILVSDTPTNITQLLAHEHAHKAVPTLEHFLPVVYIAAAAEQAGLRLSTLVDGGDFGSLTMTSAVTASALSGSGS